MQRFILHENLKKFRACLGADVADTERSYLLQQIRSIQRELALLNAAALGVQRYPIEFGALSSCDRSLFQRLTETSTQPTMIIDPRAGMRILDVNDVHTAITYTERSRVAEKGSLTSFRIIRILRMQPASQACLIPSASRHRGRRQHAMKAQRYDLRGSDGRFRALLADGVRSDPE